jgi:hypothetical protein
VNEKGVPMRSRRSLYIVCALVGAIAATAGVASAGSAAKPVKVKGTQTVVNEKKGIYDMHGSLVGRWTITVFTPRYEGSSEFAATGTERFDGCHDTDASGICDPGEPSGTMRFTFVYWASFGPNGKLVKGQCVHPVTGGTGDFAKAKGLVVMHDRPTATGVRTTYAGTLEYGTAKSSLVAPARSLAGAGAPRSCGA